MGNKLTVSQSKSDDNWVQEALGDSSKNFKITREELREIKKLKRKGLKSLAEEYYDYLKLKKTEDRPLDFTLQEYCEKRGIKYPIKK